MIEWRTDWENAPKNNEAFIYFRNNLISTAYFYWYTEDSIESFRHVAYWALQDAVKDEPLDDDGPPELSDMKWAPFPK